MNDKEYTYDIDKYTIGVDENGEDGIGLTVAKVENGEIHFLGNCYGENARCLDLLIKENQELKRQLEQNKNPLRGIFAQVNDDTLLRNCGAMQSEIDTYKNQQKEFISYLENEINKIKEQIKNYDIWHEARVDINFLILKKQLFMEDLSKYKEIIGVYDEK